MIREQQNAVARYNKQVADAEARILKWEEDKEASIAKIKAQLTSIEGIDFDGERENHKSLKQVQDRLVKLRAEEKELTKEGNVLSTKLEKNKKELGHLRDTKCPYCLQQFADADAKIKELEFEQNVIEDATKEWLGTADSNQHSLTEFAAEEARLKAEIKHPNIEALLKIKNEAETLRDKLKQTEESTNPHLEAFEALLGESIKEANTKKLDDLKNLLEHQQFMLKLLTDKNSFIRRSIINETIPFLNDRLNYYTAELGLPHLVNFADDMSCTVSEYGRELDFGNLSNGEKKRVNIAMSLAFRDVLHHLHGRANCMFIDELDGGALDLPGVDSIIRVLKKKSRDDNLAIWIISHRPEMAGRFDTEITVRKENGFSAILYGDE